MWCTEIAGSGLNGPRQSERAQGKPHEPEVCDGGADADDGAGLDDGREQVPQRRRPAEDDEPHHVRRLQSLRGEVLLTLSKIVRSSRLGS